jgi:hypothetical protein
MVVVCRAHKSYDGVQYVVDPLPETLGTRYHISGYPTQYVVDRDGHIAWNNIGYGLGDDSMERPSKRR